MQSKNQINNNYTNDHYRAVPRTGVIYVMTEATKLGFSATDKNWTNLGQGAPETGMLTDDVERITNIKVGENDYEYAPVDGLKYLKIAVANLYNERFRVGKKSKYTEKNIAICSGGRLALTRVVSILGRINVGHFLPDYTAYEELLGSFGTFQAIPIIRDPNAGFSFGVESLREEILGRGLSAVLLSNPSNPTGHVVERGELKEWVSLGKELDCSLIFDEFYSHYLYSDSGNELNLNTKKTPKLLSAAEFVHDVNKDNVIILDGLTKNWRYPGFRLSWTVAPESIIESLASAGSFLDGGCARPIQVEACNLVKKEIANKTALAIQNTFRAKRDFLISGLKSLGIQTDPTPQGAFYCWGDLSNLPKKFSCGMSFFKEALKKKVIVVPGEFFDINPGNRRPNRKSRFTQFARFSFGPSMDSLERGVESLRKMLK